MRMTFEIDEDTAAILDRCLPHGTKKHVYRHLFAGFAKKLAANPKDTLASILSYQWEVKDYMEDTNGSSEREAQHPTDGS